MEQRSHTRYPVRAPVIFQWQDEQGGEQQGGGFTRDISTGGVYVLCSPAPAPGSALRLEVMLPPIHPEARDVRLQADGRVTRVEAGGFAALSDLGLPEDRTETGDALH